MELSDVRGKIGKIDEEILHLIAERTDLASSVLKLKKGDGKSIKDVGQEQFVLNRAIDRATELNLDNQGSRRIR